MPDRLEIGSFYQGCDYHPRVAIYVDYKCDNITGISLVDGNIANCSFKNCGVIELTAKEAAQMAVFGINMSEYDEGDIVFRNKEMIDWILQFEGLEFPTESFLQG